MHSHHRNADLMLAHRNHAKLQKAMIAKAMLQKTQAAETVSRPRTDHTTEVFPSTSNMDFLTGFSRLGVQATDPETSSVPSDGMTDSSYSLEDSVRSDMDFLNDFFMLGTQTIDHETESFSSSDDEIVPNPFAAVAQMVAKLSREAAKENVGEGSTLAADFAVGGPLGSDWGKELEGPLLSWSLNTA